MPIIVAGPEIDGQRSAFFRLIFGRETGYVCLAFLSKTNRKDFKEEFFQWPAEESLLLKAVNDSMISYNVYFCPQLLRERARTKDSVSSTPVAWADLDRCDPTNMLVPPSIEVESSPGRYQAYWSLEGHPEPELVEELCRKIAYKHEPQGADKSGWDLTQLLRVPLTYNYKYMAARETPVVTVRAFKRTLYRMSDFDMYPQVEGHAHLDIPMPSYSDLEDASEVLERYRKIINPMVWRLFDTQPEAGKSWSHALWNLEMILYEQGMTRMEVFSVCREAACNKYERDHRDPILLWKDVCRAEAKHTHNISLYAPQDEEEPPLLTEEERDRLRDEPETFIERYQTWAKSLGDAAPQYHQAGAFIALSALIAGAVRLPTSFGVIIPNLWFMILADTTLTRKSTAMDISMDMVMEIDSDALLATDGSIEGLLTTLATRPGRPSVFLRDEFSGLLEQMTKKDYMAGMPELLTKLYDGKTQKRVLRKEVVEVREPILVLFAGGIKNKVTSILTFDQVSSGFMPRFVFITAESDVTKVKPLGPPTEKSTGDSDLIRTELEQLFKHYRVTQEIEIKDLGTTIARPKQFPARLTEDAWIRYNKFEAEMLTAGMASERSDVITPTYDRLAKSVLKAAVLLAAAEQRGNDVVVTEMHLLRAIMYGEQWRMYCRDVMSSVGKGQGERRFDTIMGAIDRKPGITKSNIMQSYHLDSREAASILQTLDDRGLITMDKAGRGFKIYPVGYNRTPERNPE